MKAVDQSQQQPMRCYPDVPLQEAVDAMTSEVRAHGQDLWGQVITSRLGETYRDDDDDWCVMDDGFSGIINGPDGEQWGKDYLERDPDCLRLLATLRRELLHWIESDALYIAGRDGVPFTPRYRR